MIGHFPALYPDELFYSACARAATRLKSPRNRVTARMLFGTANARAIVDFPSHIDMFLQALPRGNGLTAETLIRDHTLLPLYVPFCPSERIEKVRQRIKGNGGFDIYQRIGIRAGSVRSPEFLRCCPGCDATDRLNYGETYWHRLHQLAGVEVCLEHGCFLEQSVVPGHTGRIFYDSNCILRSFNKRLLDRSNPEHKTLVNLARSVSWVFAAKGPFPIWTTLQTRYIDLLCEQNMATCNGNTWLRKLNATILSRYSISLLRLIGCEPEGNEFLWVKRLINNHRSVQPPIRHFLLMDILGLSAESFFAKTTNGPRFFEKSPYPCLNPVCSKYRKAVISSFKLEHHYGRRETVAEFRCDDCGYSYCRVAPDCEGNSRFTAAWVRHYGYSWDRRLAELWADPSVDLRETGRRLGVNCHTVARNAAKGGLPFPRLAAQSVNRRSLKNNGSSNTNIPPDLVEVAKKIRMGEHQRQKRVRNRL
jgi:hypothetical protein